jgi:hypothetical protein
MNAFGYTDEQAEKVRLLKYRLRIVPSQLETARARYFRLVREAASLHMHDLLLPGETEFVKGRDA